MAKFEQHPGRDMGEASNDGAALWGPLTRSKAAFGAPRPAIDSFFHPYLIVFIIYYQVSALLLNFDLFGSTHIKPCPLHWCTQGFI